MITQSSKRRSREAGNVIVVTLGAVVILATIAATTLSAISSRYPTAYRTAAWEEALLSAESGVNIRSPKSPVFCPIFNLTMQERFSRHPRLRRRS